MYLVEISIQIWTWNWFLHLKEVLFGLGRTIGYLVNHSLLPLDPLEFGVGVLDSGLTVSKNALFRHFLSISICWRDKFDLLVCTTTPTLYFWFWFLLFGIYWSCYGLRRSRQAAVMSSPALGKNPVQCSPVVSSLESRQLWPAMKSNKKCAFIPDQWPSLFARCCKKSH